MRIQRWQPAHAHLPLERTLTAEFEEQQPILRDLNLWILSRSTKARLRKCKTGKENKVREKKQLFRSRILNDNMRIEKTGAVRIGCFDSVR